MSDTEKDLGEVKKIENDELEEVSGGGRGYGKATEHQTIWQRLKNFFGFGKREEDYKRDPFHNLPGYETIECSRCGRPIAVSSDTMMRQTGRRSLCVNCMLAEESREDQTSTDSQEKNRQ